MNPSHSMIEPIVNKNFRNSFKHQNGPNQNQHTNKNSSQKYQYSNNRQQYRHINTGQQHQHRKTSQQYQPRSFQISSTLSILYLKENCLGCGLNSKGVRELLMKHDGTLENCPFKGLLYIHAKASREQLFHNNHKHVSRPKEFNNNKCTPKNTVPPQAKIAHPRPKSNSVRFDEPYDHICHMNHTHEYNHLIDTQ